MKEIPKSERCKAYIKKIKQGWTPKSIIKWAQTEFDIAEATAFNEVYEVNGEINKSVKELCDKAADYIVTTIVGTIEDMPEVDYKNKLKALDLLAKVTKVYDEKPQINLNNYGFKFGDGE